MAVELTLGERPHQATWRARLQASPHGAVEVTPAYADIPHALGDVVIAWYADRVKITFPKAGPAVLRQAYLTGTDRDVIVEIKPDNFWVVDPDAADDPDDD